MPADKAIVLEASIALTGASLRRRLMPVYHSIDISDEVSLVNTIASLEYNQSLDIADIAKFIGLYTSGPAIVLLRRTVSDVEQNLTTSLNGFMAFSGDFELVRITNPTTGVVLQIKYVYS